MKKKLLLPLGIASSLLLSGCLFDSDSTDNKVSTLTQNSVVAVFTSDYTSGAMRWLDSNQLADDSLQFNQDSRIHAGGQYIYVLERFGADNLVRVDAAKLGIGDAAVEYQKSLGAGANPEDVAIVSSSLGWLALSGRGYLLKFNPATGLAMDSIDISAYSQDSTPSPQAVALALYGDTLCVVLQRLTSWSPNHPGLLLLLDANKGSIMDTIALLGHNPGEIVLEDGKLYVANSGDLMNSELDDTRSLDVVDLKTGSVKVLSTSVALGGGPSGLTLDQKNQVLYTSVYKGWGETTVAKVSLTDGKVITAKLPGVSNGFGGVAFDNKTQILYVGEQDQTLAGVKSWDGDSLRVVSSPKVLPPTGFAIANW